MMKNVFGDDDDDDEYQDGMNQEQKILDEDDVLK